MCLIGKTKYELNIVTTKFLKKKLFTYKKAHVSQIG